MAEDICGAETIGGTPCQHPTTEGGNPDRCWIPAHGGAATDHGRPAAFDDEQTRERVLMAVSTGLRVSHQASLAGVSDDTLRRALCCVKTPRNPVLAVDPCDFCARYARAHADGARKVLSDCRPEFVASASYGYSKTDEVEVSGDGPGIVFNVTEPDQD
jgi:hypothetical protein